MAESLINSEPPIPTEEAPPFNGTGPFPVLVVYPAAQSPGPSTVSGQIKLWRDFFDGTLWAQSHGGLPIQLEEPMFDALPPPPPPPRG